MISVFKFIYMVYYTYQFTYVEPDLHLWDDAHLVVMHDLINVLLNLVLKLLVIFAFLFTREIGLWFFFFLVVSLLHFVTRIILTPWNEFDCVSSFSLLWDK